MTMQPPPGAVILGLSGLNVPADQAAVQDAIRRVDPGALIWTDWAGGRIAVASAAPARALRDAVGAMGYQVRILAGDPRAKGTVAGMFGRMLLYAVIFGAIGLVGGVLLGLANSLFNPDCTRPGSSGNCAIGVGVFGLLFGAIGIPAGAVIGLIHGLVRLGR
jgi:hypothetical protein